ncbi:CRISPR-associated protein [Desulfonema limicola]|uniref:CRISPR-associated endoribonuclease Cas2 n=1 Tax=Desulfonema limicola TaxID=45656 RepID=A0A975B9D9_9BACT|nr:CRISPR-associated endonuclease Cas2 [Desulfonema limicola]QTA81096.1 CRISPR-associated protein [Desulfonema limicola]
MKKNYLIGYDISDEKRLKKVAKIVSRFGSRIQYSFYHCFISNTQKIRMKALLQKEIKEDEDQVILLPITVNQLKEMEFMGFKINLQNEGIIII